MVKNPVSLGSKVTHKYDDIINKEYPLKNLDVSKHPRMSIQDRAKIFAPFAALKGYEEEIATKQKIVVPRIELSEEAKEHLDLQFGKIKQLLLNGQHPIVTVVYFLRDRVIYEESGEYIQFTGMVAKFDESSHILQIVDKKIHLDNIYSIVGEELDEK